jgi:hypothetical protein
MGFPKQPADITRPHLPLPHCQLIHSGKRTTAPGSLRATSGTLDVRVPMRLNPRESVVLWSSGKARVTDPGRSVIVSLSLAKKTFFSFNRSLEPTGPKYAWLRLHFPMLRWRS